MVTACSRLTRRGHRRIRAAYHAKSTVAAEGLLNALACERTRPTPARPRACARV